MQEVVGYEISINDLFNSPPKPEDVHKNNNYNSSVEYDNPSPEGNNQEGIYAYITEFSKPVEFFKKYYRKILAVLILKILVAVSIIVFLVVPVVFHHTVSSTVTTNIPTTIATRIVTRNYEKKSTSSEETTATSITSIKTTPHHGDTSCNLKTKSTFLFAYSNDLPSETVLDTLNATAIPTSRYSWFGRVRFDTENMDMEFHTNTFDFFYNVEDNLPDPSARFHSTNSGSNVFSAIEKFFSNTEAPVCGSSVLILLKRYPDYAGFSQLVSLIRSHHGIVHVITSATPTGGSQPKAMYDLASRTNGMEAVEFDRYFKDVIRVFPINESYPVYATTVQLSGSGKKDLPNFFPAISHPYKIAINYQDNHAVTIESVQFVHLSWSTLGDSGSFRVDSNDIGNYIAQSFWFLNDNYKMTLNYNNLGRDAQTYQIRIYSQTAPSNWLPYSD